MPIPEIVAKYNDPVYQEIKNAFNQRSDDFPVVMLPVRLETRFMNYSRIITAKVPGQSKINTAVQKIYKLIYDVQVWLPQVGTLSPASQKTKVNAFKSTVESITTTISGIPEISGDDRVILRNAGEDLNDQAGAMQFANAGAEIEALRVSIANLRSAVEGLKLPKDSIYEKGYAYLDALEKIEKSIDNIFVLESINASKLDGELDTIDNQINAINSLIASPDFKATASTIGKIASKISYIKRRHKSGNVRLTSYKIGYTGTRDLQATEYALRTEINALKVKIDEEHIPFMQLQEQLKRYPIRRLAYRIEKAFFLLKAKNTNGYANYSALMQTKEWLYDQLHAIRERAHRPLDGDVSDINDLKSRYSQLKNQVNTFIAKSTKFKPTDRYKKAALSRLKTHLTEEYLEDLHDLEPGIKNVEEQAFVDNKIRTTTNAAFATKKNITAVRDAIVQLDTDPANTLFEIKTQLQELEAKTRITTTNTILLPRTEFNALKSSFFSLRDHINNAITAKNIPFTHELYKESQALLSKIENQIHDQQVDVFDAKDRFYDDYRKRITFTLKTETVKELWVRIYPDDIAIDNHDERLTDEEEQIGKDYYYEIYSKSEEEREALKLGAWRAAAASLGVRRGAYVVKLLEPTEVKNNTVPVRQNAMEPLLTELKALTTKKKGVEMEKATEFLSDLAGRLQNALLSSVFHACLENKPTLDDFLGRLKNLRDRLEDSIKPKTKEVEKAAINANIERVNIAGEIVFTYYRTNLVALNATYRPTLTFPTVEKKTQSWDRAGITDVMPDRFVVITKRGEFYQHVVTGKPIVKPLQVSIDPTGDQADRFTHLPNGDLEVPEEIRWLFDFEAAVDAGMGIKIPLDEDDFSLGFDLVMAYGVQDTDAQTGQETLNKLLTNHLYSDGGLEYLPVGTATNNTDEVKSPYKALDNDIDAAYDLFFAGQPPIYLTVNDTNELSITDGQFFRDALGLPSEELANLIRHHDKKDIAQGRAMNRALYNATLKYYFKVMVPNLFNDNDIDRTMLFMMHNVSATGTLPVFRIDSQPYGVLPISPIKHFKAQGSTNLGTEGSYIKNLSLFLKQTKAAFEHFDGQPVTVNSEAYETDPQAEFLKILGLEPFSKEFFYRFGVNMASRWQEPNPDELDFTVNWDNITGSFNPTNVAGNYDYLLKQMGHTTASTQQNAIKKSNIYTNRFTEGNYILGPLVQDHALGTDALVTTSTGKNYIEWLHDFSPKLNLTRLQIGELPTVNVDGEDVVQHSLLLTMLRGSLIYDSSSWALRTYDILKDLDVLTLERLLANHVDLVSYRLDAWLTGLYNYRLNELRRTNAQGSYVGAYGFVHDLRPSIPLARAQTLPNGLTPTDGSEVYLMPDNQGFIHGPSMNHAVTAAVLRAGYNSIKSKGDNNNALAVNLTSSRVRKALTLLEGVGNGQESGALLGYMFERALHEKYQDGNGKPLEMDVHIYRLRRKFPTYADAQVDPTSTAQTEAVKAANVVDGLALIDHIESELEKANLLDPDNTLVENIINDNGGTIQFSGYPWGLADELPDPNNPPTGSTADLERKKIRAIIHEIDNMADAFDALGDLVTAEGVYQLVRGNHVRASAVLNAISEGRVPLDPEIIRSMRQGVMVTHRALLNIPVVTDATSPWTGVAASPRSVAEPALNSWLAGQIGDPDNVDWKAVFGNTEMFITLKDLNLQPVDLVMLITAGGDDGQAEFQARCIDYLLTQGATSLDDVTLSFNECSPQADFSFGEMVSLFQHLGKVISAARAADARDYRISEDPANFEALAPGFDTDDLLARMQAALTDYQALYATLSPFDASKTAYSATEHDLAVASLKALTQWGFAGFYPTDRDADAITLAARIISAKTKMEEHIAFAEQALAELVLEVDQGKWASVATDFGTRFFGNGFKMLPVVVFNNAVEFDNLREQLDMNWAESPMRHHPENIMEDWLGDIALVRKRLAHVETVSLLGEMMQGNTLSVKPVQLPFDMNSLPAVAEREYWLGAAYPETYKPDGDRLSLMLFGEENLQATTCALMLDEWMEIIPDEKETSGIALHYNQPDARAPQNILLAVPPEKEGNWNFETLALCIEEAYSLAKLRAIEPEQIDFSMFSQLLPATTTLAFGDDEMARRLSQAVSGGVNDSAQLDQKLGYYIDYTSVNHGIQPETEE